MKEANSTSRYYPIAGDLGITVNVFNKGDSPNGFVACEVKVINCVRKHEPVTKKNSFKDVKNSTLTRITDRDFSSFKEAEEYIRQLQE